MLGFSAVSLLPNTKHISNLPEDIIKINTIHVECNIVRGTFDNRREGHEIHKFYPLVPPGYKIVEITNTIVYLTVNVRRNTQHYGCLERSERKSYKFENRDCLISFTRKESQWA